jgi:TolA-binding protein
MARTPSGLVGSIGARGTLVVLLVVAGAVVGGCSFLGRQYSNFTAYYNKFHNAEKAFEKGVDRISTDDLSVDRTRYLSIFRKPTGATEGGAFDQAIQKSADVLREHPDSKWTDDALLLIGKSYFYQQSYVGAAEKFREVLAVDGGRTEEARFWLARTLTEVGRVEEAGDVLRMGMQEGDSSPWLARLYLVRGELNARQENWEKAVRALDRGLQGALPDRLKARASFLLGQVLETLGSSQAARRAYRQVQEHSPPYALGFAARLSEIELQGKHGDATQALDRLETLEDDEKNVDQRGEMALVRARILRVQGQFDRARRALARALYSEDAPPSASEGRLHYELARLYREALENFSRAAAHFDTARTVLNRGQSRERQRGGRLPGTPRNVDAEAERYRELADRAREVARMDSLLRIGRMGDPEFRRFVEKLQQRRRERNAQTAEEGSDQSRRLRGRGQRVVEERRQTTPASNTGQSDAGFLFHKDPARVQQGKREFERVWGDRPLVDNWRRRRAIRTASVSSGDEDDGTPEPSRASVDPGGTPQGNASNESAVDLSAIPRDAASQRKMEADRAVARYEFANSLFLAAGRPDSAATWYRRILQENGDHPVARRALYALAEAYREQGDPTAARQMYRRLIDQYPDTDLAARARQRLGRRQSTATQNRAVPADSAYAEAYDQWRNGDRLNAFPTLLHVARQYPNTDAAPRALLAAGLVYWQEVERDSTGLLRSTLQRSLRVLRRPDSVAGPVLPALNDSGAGSELGTTESVAVTLPKDGSSTLDSMTIADRMAEVLSDSSQSAISDRPGQPSRRATSDYIQHSADSFGVAGRTRDSVRKPAPGLSKMDRYTLLDSLMAYLMDRYPDAPQVVRARTIRASIDERRAADSTAADSSTQASPLADSEAAAEHSAAVQQRAAEGADRTERNQDRSAQPPSSDPGKNRQYQEEDDEDPLPAPTDSSGLEEQDRRQQIDRSRGGWTVRVDSFSTQEEATQFAEAVRPRIDRWPVDLLTVNGEEGLHHHLVVGQFEGRKEAVEAKRLVGPQLSAQPTLMKIPSSP